MLTASFIPFFIISFLIIIHELGHFLTAKFLKVEVDKIIIYPLGGISKFNMPINIAMKKEFLILVAGPIFQVLAYIILLKILPDYQKMITIYHYGILMFNLLPIYPLDGGKLINLLLSLKIPLKMSLYLTMYVSYLFTLLLFIINMKNMNLNIIIMIVFLIYKIEKEHQQIHIIYKKFLLERYLHNYQFKNSILIKNQEQFHRDKRHLIQIGNHYYLEREFLDKMHKKY